MTRERAPRSTHEQHKGGSMSRTRRVSAAILAALALTATSVVVPTSLGASTKTCTESGQPHNNFTTTYTQTPSCNSNSTVNQSPQTATNNGGNQPPGQQP